MDKNYFYDCDSDTIIDVVTFFNVLLSIVNKDVYLYDIKAIFTEKENSIIYLIARREVLNKIALNGYLFNNNCNEIAQKILDMKSSLIIFKNNESSVIFDLEYNRHDVVAFDIKASGKFSNPLFYLYHDDLKKAVRVLFVQLKTLNKKNEDILYSKLLKK